MVSEEHLNVVYSIVLEAIEEALEKEKLTVEQVEEVARIVRKELNTQQSPEEFLSIIETLDMYIPNISDHIKHVMKNLDI